MKGKRIRDRPLKARAAFVLRQGAPVALHIDVFTEVSASRLDPAPAAAPGSLPRLARVDKSRDGA